MDAVCGPLAIIGHMTPRGTGVNGLLAWARVWQAACGLGWVPPAGSQVRVQRFGVAPWAARTVMVIEEAGLAAPSLAPVWLPQAVARAAPAHRGGGGPALRPALVSGLKVFMVVGREGRSAGSFYWLLLTHRNPV